MKKKILMAEFVLVASLFSAWAEPGGTYTLTGEEKGVEEIIKADMAQHPELYKGESLNSYVAKFKKENKIGKRKLSPGNQLHFPDTLASLKAKRSSVAQEEKPAKPNELPRTFKLRGLPEVVQDGSYCVPASGTVIAKFHGIKTDQWEIAKLSSQNSMDNSGTNPNDMARALENFGIRFHRIEYKHAPGDVDDFMKKTLSQFKKALVHEGPMYISIREIFGGNHGCVVIGYSDTRKKMYFYNPWGEEFNLSYREVEKYTYRAIAFTPPKLLEDEIVDCTSLIETLKQVSPNNAQNVIELRKILKTSSVSFKFVECNRRDTMNDASMTERLASREGRKLIDLAMERVPAILIPQTDDEGVTDYMFIRKSPESKRKLLVQRIGSRGWGAPELSSSRILIRCWTTPVDVKGEKQWLLPLFEFSGIKKSSGDASVKKVPTSPKKKEIKTVQLPTIKNRDRLSQEELEMVLALKKENTYSLQKDHKVYNGIKFIEKGIETKIILPNGDERIVRYRQNLLFKNSRAWSYKWEIDNNGRLILSNGGKAIYKFTVSINDKNKLIMKCNWKKGVCMKED